MNKPIISVEALDSRRASPYVRESSDVVLGWDTDLIVKTIRKYR